MIIRVRDHNRPCEHGSLWHHWTVMKNAKWWQEPECLGGHEMVLEDAGNGLWRELNEERPADPQ